MTDGGSVEIVRTVADLRARVSAWRAADLSVGLVPTMGALHAGHLSLVGQSMTLTDRTCATLFVNPKQFGPNEDFEHYPRTEQSDAAELAALGAHLLFAPEVAEMYAPEAVTTVSVPGIGDLLEGEFRPGFFTGVATVVTKLLLQAQPDVAIFGEKDFQQLQVIQRMVADLDIPVRIEGGPTVRETDGLALSSRNAYLTPAERKEAPALYRALSAVAERVGDGGDVAQAEAWARTELDTAGFDRIDYLTVRDAHSLVSVDEVTGPARVLGAAWLGRTRLIDNVAV